MDGKYKAKGQRQKSFFQIRGDRWIISAEATIVDYAESQNINLIVVGTRGRSGFSKVLLGSVASKVVTYAHCPVLVVK